MRKYQPLIYLLLFQLFNIHGFCQESFDSSLARAASVYTNFVNLGAHIYNGSEYVDYDHKIKGNPFFESSYFNNGDLVYDGVSYKNLNMFYDILHDDVVIRNYNDTAMILVKEKISAFNFLNHSFINIIADSVLANEKTAGFYDVLYNGNIKLIAKRKKEIVENIRVENSESFFVEKDNFYILKNEVLFAVNDKNSVLDVLKDKKSSIEKFLHQSKLKYRKKPEETMIKMVAYYDALNKAK
jgi:hypothetical protein